MTQRSKVPESAAPARRRPPGGSRKGIPNKVTSEVKAMVIQALQEAGGVDYLKTQAVQNPKAFLSLVGRVLPLQVTGEGGGPLQITLSAREADL